MREARRAVRILGALALLTSLGLAGCARGKDFREAEAAVKAYNLALIEAYNASDPRRMESVATAKECRKIWALIDLKRAAGLVLENTLESSEVLSVRKVGPNDMAVETRERWRYFDRPLRPGVSAGPVFVADMRMRYEFVRDGKAWKMDQGKTLTCGYLEPPGFRPDPRTHQPPPPGKRSAAETDS